MQFPTLPCLAIFVPKGGGGSCVFYQPHFQMLRPTPPILFDQSLMVMARNKNLDNVSQTDQRLYRRLSYPVRAIFTYISVQNLSNHEQEKQNVCTARRVTLLRRSWINFSPCKHSGPPSRVKAQTRHAEHAQAPLARGREGKSLRGEAGGGGGWSCVASRGHFSWVSE